MTEASSELPPPAEHEKSELSEYDIAALAFDTATAEFLDIIYEKIMNSNSTDKTPDDVEAALSNSIDALELYMIETCNWCSNNGSSLDTTSNVNDDTVVERIEASLKISVKELFDMIYEATRLKQFSYTAVDEESIENIVLINRRNYRADEDFIALVCDDYLVLLQRTVDELATAINGWLA